jgi:hypothetical protein
VLAPLHKTCGIRHWLTEPCPSAARTKKRTKDDERAVTMEGTKNSERARIVESTKARKRKR